MKKKVFGKIPVILALLVLALASTRCGNGFDTDPGDQYEAAVGTLTITGLQAFAGGEISAVGKTEDGVFFFWHMGYFPVCEEGTAAITLSRSNLITWTPTVWVNDRVVFDIDIYDVEDNHTAGTVTVTFSDDTAAFDKNDMILLP